MTSVKTWYVTLNKPSFNPPGWVFGPVWTMLYAMMGVSLFLIVRNGGIFDNFSLVIIFAIQLVLNFLWTSIFFALKSPFWAFIEISLLWIFIMICIIKFFPVSKTASLLLIPYIAWVSFAGVLNFFIWRLN